MNGIELVFLPPYSPDLNPIEYIWKSIKRVVSRNFIVDLDYMEKLICESFLEFSSKITGSSLFYVGRSNLSFPNLRYIVMIKLFVVLKPLAPSFAD